MSNIRKDKISEVLDKKVFFFIGISKRWGTIERNIIMDCEIAQEHGANVYLYCLKNSVLDLKARDSGIERLYHIGSAKGRAFRWMKFKSLIKLMKELKVSLIHCYDLRTIWPLNLYLRSAPLVPLVFTPGSEIQKFYHHIWFRPFMGRIDQVFLPGQEMSDNIWGHLGIPPRKADVLGFGRKGAFSPPPPRPPFRFTEKRWYIGTNLNGIESKTSFLDVLFHSFRVMLEKGLAEKSYTLVLVSEKAWHDFPISSELKRQVKDLGIEEHVAFVGPCEMREIQPHIDLWIGLNRREELEDYVVDSLLVGTPALMPRTSLSMELISKMGGLGETYRRLDSRELREKAEKILLNLDTYKSRLSQAKESLIEEHGYKNYGSQLSSIYKNLILRRERFQRFRIKKIRAFRFNKKP